MLDHVALAAGAPSRRSLMSLLTERAPEGAANLGIGEPTHPTPPDLVAFMQALIAEDSANYGPVAGLPGLRTALAARHDRASRTDLGPDNVVATCGATQAIFTSLAALLEDGGEIIHPDPGYVLYAPAIRACGGIPVPLELDRSAGFRVDPAALARLITPSTKGVIVNSPGNPTGKVIRSDDLRAIAEVCDEAAVPIVSDEIYEHLVYEGEHRSVSEFSENVIVCSGMSKLFRLSGWRLGWCVAPAPFFERILVHHQYSVFRASTVAQRVAQAALTMDADIAAMVGTLRRKRELLLGLLGGIEGLGVTRPDSTLFAYVDFSAYGDDWVLANRFLTHGVVTVPSTGPGAGFGNNGRGLIRLSFAADEDTISAGVRGMREALSCS